jgi:ketol-acid reductoisomerase
MASRRAPQLLRSSLAQAAKAPLGGARVLPALSGLTARTAALVTQRATVSLPFEQARGMKTIDFAGTKETVYGTVMERMLSTWLTGNRTG